MPDRVYIETTFVSYLAARPSRDVVIAGYQQIANDWWNQSRVDLELCASQLVLQEASDGDPVAAAERLKLLKAMLLLDTTEAAVRLAEDSFAREPCRKRPRMMLFMLQSRPNSRYPIC